MIIPLLWTEYRDAVTLTVSGVSYLECLIVPSGVWWCLVTDRVYTTGVWWCLVTERVYTTGVWLRVKANRHVVTDTVLARSGHDHNKISKNYNKCIKYYL